MDKKKKKSNKIIYILIAVLIGLVILVVVLKKMSKKEIEVSTDYPKTLTIIEKISASGMVQPVNEVKISPDVGGEIIELNVEESDSVTINQLLVKIRPDNFISAVERAEASLNQQKANLLSTKASLARAEATFERAKLDYHRNEKLHHEEVISTAEWEISKQNFKIGQNDLAAAKATVLSAKYIVKSSKATVDEAKENLRMTSVLAPIGGTVSKLLVKKGERVVGIAQIAGTEMLRIADLNNMEVRVDVNENDIIRISLGDTSIIDVDAYTHLDKKFKGIVTKIANTAKDKVSADAVTEFEVRIRILSSSYADLKAEGNAHPFKPGMTASVDIITKTKANILTVPLAAVTVRKESELEEAKEVKGEEAGKEKPKKMGKGSRAGGGSRNRGIDEENSEDDKKIEIIFINDNGVAKILKVKTGISDYERIEILSELSDSVKVITGPFIAVSKRLKAGDFVKEEEKKDEKSKK